MDMQGAVRSFFKRYTDFQGRSSRSEYWWVYLAYILAAIAILIVFSILSMVSDILGFVAMSLVFLASLAVIVPALALTFRRLHDSDKSAWWILISLIPLGSIVLIVFFCLPGTPGTNKFGPDPLGNTGEVFT